MTLPSEPQHRAYFCPQCGSAAVDTSTLAHEGRCEMCGWKGNLEELATFHFSHDLGSPDQVAAVFLSEVTRLFSKDFALPLAKLLIKWGFLDAAPPKDPKKLQRYTQTLGRYIAQAAKATAQSFFETRKQIEVEAHERKT